MGFLARRRTFSLLVSLPAAWAFGCGGGQTQGAPAGADAGPAADASVPASDAQTFSTIESGAAQSLSVTPATTSLVVTDLSALPSTSFRATATLSDGSSAPVDASWSIDRLDIATVSAGGGTVTAAGTAFGTATITATAQGLTARATITVALKATMATVSLSPADQAALASASASDPSVQGLAYPYDRTVFPQGLLGPELMWNGGSPGDAYLLHLTAPAFDLSVFTSADPPSRYPIPGAVWNALAATAAGADVQVTLSRLSGSSAYASARESWTMANANLRGTIYYWSIADGQIMKLDLTTGTAAPAFDTGSALALGTPAPLDSTTPASPPWEDALPGDKRCVACHAVSKDGSTLGAVFSRSDSAGPFGFVSLKSGQVSAVGSYPVNGAFEALTPDGKFAVLNDNFMTLALADAATGASVPSLFDGQANLCDPVFSPDGTRFAVASNCGQGDPQAYPVQYATSSLSLFDFAEAPNPTFSNPRVLVAGASPDAGVADAIAFPSFSPDSNWLFFQRGSNSRAKINFAAPYTHGVDDLYVAPVQGGATVALDQANGKGTLSPDNLHLNYAPTVNPIAAGGYIWVVFTSPRDYGNRLGMGRVGGSTSYPGDATYANNKQLWVTAVDANVGTIDPSHPAFWLPGQSNDSINMFGYWALAPCKPSGGEGGPPASCGAGFECCSGFCRDGACVDSAGGCRQLGETCQTAGDCCASDAVVCAAGVCQQLVPH